MPYTIDDVVGEATGSEPLTDAQKQELADLWNASEAANAAKPPPSPLAPEAEALRVEASPHFYDDPTLALYGAVDAMVAQVEAIREAAGVASVPVFAELRQRVEHARANPIPAPTPTPTP